MKKVFICLLLGSILLCGCKVKESKNNLKENPKKINDSYVFTVQNNDLVLGSYFDLKKLGKEKKYSETASCAFEGIDKTYTYDHFEVTTYPKDNKDIIGNIYFLDENIKTKEGVGISDSIDKVIATYGSNYQQEGTLFKYQKGDMELKFIIEDDLVTSIEYALIV